MQHYEDETGPPGSCVLMHSRLLSKNLERRKFDDTIWPLDFSFYFRRKYQFTQTHFAILSEIESRINPR